MKKLNEQKTKGYYAPYDARTGLGYGVLKPTGFNASRAYNQYPENPTEDLEAAEEIDPETYEVILDKVLTYMAGDPYAKNKADPFYYVAGNTTRLAELSAGTGMVPFPRMYAKRTGSGFGGSGKALPFPGPTNTFRTVSRPTGTKKGFSQPPPPISSLEDVTGPEYTLKSIIDTNQDEKHLDRIRDLIALIHMEQDDIQ
ncbi:hypothetical protein CL634_06100 [bacterium]|nr:hypothetical protein [bacterium]